MGHARTCPPPPTTIYQLRVVLRGISPLIWRRLLVPADTTLAGLHEILQVVFGWAGEHLHRFVVHGVDYEAYVGDDRLRLVDLGLRETERFVYDYDFTDFWRHDLRVEHVLTADAGKRYPRCSGGRRAGPPEDCGGPWAFVELTEPYRVFAAISRAAEIIGRLLDDDISISQLGEQREEMASLLPWLGLERFDRRAINRALGGLGDTERRAA
ncbi:MAG: plasmid pRiA4b ORF-3 family protein [Acidimicrobiales bacterium]